MRNFLIVVAVSFFLLLPVVVAIAENIAPHHCEQLYDPAKLDFDNI